MGFVNSSTQNWLYLKRQWLRETSFSMICLELCYLKWIKMAANQLFGVKVNFAVYKMRSFFKGPLTKCL